MHCLQELPITYHPWNIYHKLFAIHVGKYSSPTDGMGDGPMCRCAIFEAKKEVQGSKFRVMWGKVSPGGRW